MAACTDGRPYFYLPRFFAILTVRAKNTHVLKRKEKKMSKKWHLPKISKDELAAILFVVAFLAFLSAAGILSAREERAEKLRFEALTPEQQEAERKEKEAAYNANIHDCELVSIFPYVYTETNRYGGIEDQKIKYNIMYISDDGATHTDDDFEGDISIGESDIYRVNDNVGQYDKAHTSVILTKDTAAKLKIQQ